MAGPLEIGLTKPLDVRREYLRADPFVNINDQLTDVAGKLLPGMTTDGLHLEQPAYGIWATALRLVLQDILGSPDADDLAPAATRDPRATR